MRTLVLLALLSMSATKVYADTSKTFKFENQREETFDLENFLKETRTRKETIDTTCYRQEPYTENVCRDVTHYREECHSVPSHEECTTVNDRVCKTEHKSDYQCHTVPGEQECRVVIRYHEECTRERRPGQCHTVPGDIQCHIDANGENRCVKIPPHEECDSDSDEQVCRQAPYEERECSEGPSRQECEYVDVPYEVCEDVSRQQCETVPTHNECEQIPYEVNECKDEILYRQIPYACQKEIEVPYEVVVKTQRANVLVKFADGSNDVPSQFTVALDEKGALALKGSAVDGSKPLALAKKDVKTTAQADVNNIKALYNINLMNLDQEFSVSQKGISDVVLKKTSLTFVVNGKFDQKRAKLAVKIASKKDVKLDKTLTSSQFKTHYDGSVTQVEIDLESLGVKIPGIFVKSFSVGLKLKMDFTDLGEMIIPATGEISIEKNVDVKL